MNWYLLWDLVCQDQSVSGNKTRDLNEQVGTFKRNFIVSVSYSSILTKEHAFAWKLTRKQAES